MADSDDKQPPNPKKQDPSKSEGSSTIEKPEVEKDIDQLISKLPDEKKTTILHEMFMGFVERTGTPAINAEVAKILSESQDKENQNRLQYLLTREENNEAAKKRDHEFRLTKHQDNFAVLKPIIAVVLVIVAGCTVAGIWLCIINRESIGASILSGIWGAVFGYLAGFGTSNFFKNDQA